MFKFAHSSGYRHWDKDHFYFLASGNQAFRFVISDEDITIGKPEWMKPVQKRKTHPKKKMQQKGCANWGFVLICNQGVAYGVNRLDKQVEQEAHPSINFKVLMIKQGENHE